MELIHRPRRLRRTDAVRRLCRETRMSPDSLIYPIFVDETLSGVRPIPSLPGQNHYGLDSVNQAVEECLAHGVTHCMLFGLPGAKDACGSSAWAEKGVIQQAVRAIKAAHPDFYVITDVCLCEYTDHGHCGILHGCEVDNDETLDVLAKVAVNTGIQLENVLKAGPALILQELGNLGTILLALPLALLLGFGREAVGMTHSISREPNVAYIATKYGSESAEFRGVMVTYIVGTLLGTIFMGLMASVLGGLGILHPYSLAMACGVGSGSMMAASSASLAAAFPEMAEQISAYAGTSNVLSNADGVVMTVILGVPMCNWMYNKLYPAIGRGKKEKKA